MEDINPQNMKTGCYNGGNAIMKHRQKCYFEHIKKKLNDPTK